MFSAFKHKKKPRTKQFWLPEIGYQPNDHFRPVRFVFERARAQRHFLLVKGHPMRKFKYSTVRAPKQLPRGMEAITYSMCFHEVSDLPFQVYK